MNLDLLHKQLKRNAKGWLLTSACIVGLGSLNSIALAQPLALPGQNTQPPSSAPKASQVDSRVEQTIISRLKKARPELNFTDIEPSPIAGIYHVKINGQLAFVSEDGRYMIAGEMYEVQENNLVNLQEKEREAAELAFIPKRAAIMKALDTKDMVIYKPTGESKGYVNIFTDIDCGYCRKLHSQMQTYLAKGIEIRYLAFPRAGANSKSAQKLETVWCSDKPQELMDRFKRGENVAINTCEGNPVSEQYQLGQRVGVTGTPAIVLESGKIIPGAVSADYLAKEMGI